MPKWKKVQICKVDLDTIGCAFVLGVGRDDAVEVLRSGIATEVDLSDPFVLCIEVGGAGRVDESNFDHHEPGGPDFCATMQAFQEEMERGLADLRLRYCGDSQIFNVGALVNYINILDTSGRFESAPRPEEFPYLSDVIGGMLISVRDPKAQFLRGVEILEEVIGTGQNPAKGPIPGFDEYARVKAENDRKVTNALKNAKWTTTAHGRKLGYLETDFIGAPGALYGSGAEIAVAFSPNFGNPPVPKFTVAGNGIRVDRVLPILNALETGWGGPGTGTIIGSPRLGSKLTLKEVVDLVRGSL